MTEKNIQDLDGITEADLADLEFLQGDETPAPQARTILSTWKELLKSIENSEQERISPAFANSIVTNWPKLSFQDLAKYSKAYHSLLKEMREILHVIIDEDTSVLDNIEDDATENRAVYLELLFQWHSCIMSWEHEWDCTSKDSHIMIAAIADATAFFVGQQGLVAHLESIQFQMDEETSNALQGRLVEFKETL